MTKQEIFEQIAQQFQILEAENSGTTKASQQQQQDPRQQLQPNFSTGSLRQASSTTTAKK